MKYPNYDTYQKLYGRYLIKGPYRFFERCDPTGKRVLDLCTGGGQLARYAFDHNAKFIQLVDLSPDMLDPMLKKQYNNIGKLTMAVEYYLSAFNQESFDIVVCRQAVNYWFKYVNGIEIANVVKPGGYFVFNTFGNKPSETPTVREYYHDGVAYKELSYLIEDRIYHVQSCTGIPPHFTSFDWIDREEYSNKLKPYFDIEEVVDGPSSMWYCKRKS